MTNDIQTMIWKEFREFDRMAMGTAASTSKMGGIIRRLLPLVVVSVWIPLRAREAWVTNTSSLASMLFVPMFFMMFAIVDSFAGERERHTLETLLATRLSDQAILIGKVASAVAYGITRVAIYLVIGLITVNILNVVDGHSGILMFAAGDMVALFVFAFLLCSLIASAGVLVSLRAATVQQASRNLSLGFMVLVFGTIFLSGPTVLPAELRASIYKALFTESIVRTELIAGVILLVLDVLLFYPRLGCGFSGRG